ncbi:unnamed protein product [Parascedosporium putredinis]|uniref:Bifunctional cytochrome P450/NADPH--P450 reductase n=1 Tax=Parascedosporium putredinis TaxID=1442378 RepID=A0A9P1H097_9PEZI|nr:unnamed protein product [Parascedosporium putredinis]CAI7993660.1 unnamed protein product [Parascedosporium putredinis]
MPEPVEETVPIPEPQGLPLLGHVRSINPDFPLGSMPNPPRLFHYHPADHAHRKGEIYRLNFAGSTTVVVSTHELVNETCDEKRFQKTISKTLQQVRNGVHDGLFTAHNNSEEWAIAHRILMPAFGPLSIRNMYPEMHDVAAQLAMKWARHGPSAPIHVTDDFTRLTLDTIALCSMDFRFNSFYSPQLHPFVEAMGDFLKECGARAQRLPLLPAGLLHRARDQKYERDIEVLRSTAQSVLDARRAERSSNDRKDLLSAMLRGVDPKTGRRMSDDSIMDNLITFLIAGHETTSGTLSFAFYQLLRHPDAYAKAQQEVGSVVGTGPIHVDHLSRLPFLNAVLRETLRVNAPIPMFAVEAKEDTLLLGKYPVKKGEPIVNLLARAHVDPAVFGEDADEFKPERMLDANFDRLNNEFPNCWKPFGNGARGCIGRPFAWQEALLVMAMLLQNFNFVLDPKYTLGIKQTLTIKPADMHFRAILRDGLTPPPSSTGCPAKASNGQHANGGEPAAATTTGIPMTILYGSNSGTCEALAQRVAADASTHGFRVDKLDCLDSANGKLPATNPSSSSPPPTRASPRQRRPLSASPPPLEGVTYAVFGCGHRDWTQTFHRVPKLVDCTLADRGADRLVDIGLSDVSAAATFSDFETWEDDKLWPALKERFKPEADGRPGSSAGSATTALKVQVLNPRTSALRQDVKEAVVVEARTLTSGSQEKRHIEIKLPEGMTYSAGDYLAVLPSNPEQTVRRVMRRFKLQWDAQILIESEIHTSLPVNTAQKNVLVLADAAVDDKTKAELTRLANDGFDKEVTGKRCSVLDLLERFPTVELDVGTFLSMMPPIRVRQYSISSSPLWKPDHVTITYSVVHALPLRPRLLLWRRLLLPRLPLRRRPPRRIRTPLRRTLQPPRRSGADAHRMRLRRHGPRPLSRLCPRASRHDPQRAPTRPRHALLRLPIPETDDLYREEFDEWERLGAVEVRRAYSQAGAGAEAGHVQDRLWADRYDVIPLWVEGAKVYMCGARKVSDAVRDVWVKVREEYLRKEGKTEGEDEARTWFEGLRNVRYVMDVFD